MAKHNKARKRANQLTRRQIAILKNLQEGRLTAEPAWRADYSEKNLAQPSQQRSRPTRLTPREVMDSLGLTDEVLVEKYLRPQLLATTTKSMRGTGKVRQITVPDYSIRSKALDMIFRLIGAYSSKDQKPDEQFGVKVIVLDMPRPPKPTGSRSGLSLEDDSDEE